jgi:hypothetical protein
LDTFCETSSDNIFIQGKGKGKGKGKGRGRDDEETNKENKPSEEIKEIKKLRTLDVFAGCGGEISKQLDDTCMRMCDIDERECVVFSM